MRWWRRWRRGDERLDAPSVVEAVVDISPDDPLLPLLLALGRPVDVDELELDSPAVTAMREAGVVLLVPMVSHGELISVLQLGSRRSDQPYNADDRSLLASVAGGAAPALRVAQLLDEREREARARERVAAELRVAQLIQQHFLPRRLPNRPGWTVEAYYQPAREVGGDFYDFVELEDGLLGIVVGDVTDKGVPAALVMTSTRTLLRASAQRLVEPAEVLTRVNAQLHDDIPPAMFVTCLYGILDPASGEFRFANAGHNLPIHLDDGSVAEPRATGLPLGLMPEADYDEAKVTIGDGDALILYSDALPEAHGPSGEMFGFASVTAAAARIGEGPIVDHFLHELERFAGSEWEQEDDVTIVALRRRPPQRIVEIPSIEGSERRAIDEVTEFARDLLPPDRVERLATAVGEATMNAIEHGNASDPSIPVEVWMSHRDGAVVVHIADRGAGIEGSGEPPDLDAKVRGEQSPRGWGRFLIEEMVDDVTTSSAGGRHFVTLTMRTEEAGDG